MRSPTRALAAFALLAAAVVAAPAAASASVRLKDIAKFDGVRRNQLIGYGLVVGLNGTGDTQADFTNQATANLLERLGVSVTSRNMKLKNTAAVMVTADLPAFARAGQRVDVLVSSMGDAKNLQGGTLVLTPLRAPNGQVFAGAQGAVATGGYESSSRGATTSKNHPTAARIPGGATLEHDSPLPVLNGDHVDLVLDRADFTTATRVCAAVKSAFGESSAQALDAGRVRVALKPEQSADPVNFLSALESVPVDPDLVARVVLDEKNGTIVLGQAVRVRPVAVSYGALTVQVAPKMEVSQPQPMSYTGRTAVMRTADVTAREQPSHLALVEQGEDLGSLVKALNALGVTPRDLVTIFQTLKAAGALEAELELL